MSMTVQDLAAWLGGEVIGNPSLVVEKAQSLDLAGSKSLTFYTGDRQSPRLKALRAAAILIPPALRKAVGVPPPETALIVVDDPKDSFLKVAGRLAPRSPRPEVGISPHAFVSATAQIGKGANIHPGAYVGPGVILGDHCEIYPGAVVSRGCRIGNHFVLHPNAVLYEDVIVGNRVIIHAGAIIGAEGFGYRTVAGRHERVPHFGTVRIEDDVEIGAVSTIDRALIDETVIGQGTKIDNLVMIGHNCRIGRHNLFASQVGFAGSVTTGDYVVCAGQVGVADHVHLANRSMLGAKAGIHKDVPEGERQIGAPSLPEAQCHRVFMAQQKLPEMRKKLRALENQVKELSLRLQQSISSKDLLVAELDGNVETESAADPKDDRDRFVIETARPETDANHRRDRNANDARGADAKRDAA